jgi:ATP-dependent Clp protease ATP-binding subunit ClpA
MFERFTDQARAVIVRAQEESRRLRHPYIGTEHLLLGLLDPSTGATATVLADAGVTREAVRDGIQRALGHGRPPLTAEDAEALKSIGIDVERVLARLEETLGAAALAPCPEPRRSFFRRRRTTGGHIPLTARSKKVLELSLREALALKSRHIGSEHILLGLVREGNGLAATVLVEQGVDLDALRAATLRALDQAA